MTALPLNRLINVAISFTPPPAQFPNLSTCLCLGTSNVIDVHERMRQYGGLDEVGVDFSTTDEEYLSAVLWFEQRPQPTTFNIGRWAKVATSGLLAGGGVSAANQLPAFWNAIHDGSFQIFVDGVGPSNVGNLDFGASANMNAVAAVIASGIPGGTATCVWDSEHNRFVITSVTTGVGSTVSFATAGTTGTDISASAALLATSSGAYVADGVGAQTALETVILFDNQFSTKFYGLVIPSAVDGDHLAVAGYVEGATNPHYYGVTTQEAGVITAGDTANIAYLLKQLAYDATTVQYSSTSAYAVFSYLSRILTTDWNANNSTITLMYKTEPGIVAESLTTAQANAAQSCNANVFVNYNNDQAFVQYGVSASGQYTDSVVGGDWLRGQVQTNIFNLLFGARKVPQTDAGMHLIATQIEAAMDSAVNNGLLAPGVWNAGGFGQLKQGDFLPKGYYVFAPPISSQNQANRAARMSVPFQVAAKLGGAVHTVDVQIEVNE